MKFDKSRVFTVANANEVVAGSKGYFADNMSDLRDKVEDDGTIIGELLHVMTDDYEYRFETYDSYRFGLFYLVEEPKEKKLRPYNSTDEMVEDFKRRFNANVPPYAMPLIWIKAKNTDKKYLIVRFASALTICLNVEVYTPTFEDLAEGYTYLDGSPCGMEVTE